MLCSSELGGETSTQRATARETTGETAGGVGGELRIFQAYNYFQIYYDLNHILPSCLLFIAESRKYHHSSCTFTQ
jgi:hypothetical protein